MSELTVSIENITWLTGSWQGSLGPMTVEEIWYPPKLGSMQMMIRLSNPDSIAMYEFIMVEEFVDDEGRPSLRLHLRQYLPTMDLQTEQIMPMIEHSERSVSFTGDPSDNVARLDYTLIEDNRLKVDVTVATGDVVTAELDRN